MLRDNKFFYGFITGATIAAIGAAIRLNAAGLSAAAYSNSQGSSTIYDPDNQVALSEISLGIFVLGLLLLLLVFQRWLNGKSG